MTSPQRSNARQRRRVMVLRENWLGCTGLSAFNAFLRAGMWVTSISEGDHIPLQSASLPIRAVARALRPLFVAEFNRAVVSLADEFRPQLVFVVKGTFLHSRTVEAMRAIHASVYCFYPDVSVLEHGPYIPKTLPHYDWVFTTKSFGPADLKRLLSVERASFLPHAADPQVHRPWLPPEGERASYACDVSFVGTWSPDKEATLTHLRERRPSLGLRVWGNQWDRVPGNSPLRSAIAHRALTGLSYAAAVSSSAINLGLLSERRAGASSGDLVTSRTFHIPACGGFLLHQRSPDLGLFFQEGQECAAFASPHELCEKVDAFLSDQERRQQIARRGRAEVLRHHLWDHRVRTVLDHHMQQSHGSR